MRDSCIRIIQIKLNVRNRQISDSSLTAAKSDKLDLVFRILFFQKFWPYRKYSKNNCLQKIFRTKNSHNSFKKFQASGTKMFLGRFGRQTNYVDSPRWELLWGYPLPWNPPWIRGWWKADKNQYSFPYDQYDGRRKPHKPLGPKSNQFVVYSESILFRTTCKFERQGSVKLPHRTYCHTDVSVVLNL